MTEVPMPEVRMTPPPLRAQTTNDGVFDLAEQAGRWVAVYFYPRANTPG